MSPALELTPNPIEDLPPSVYETKFHAAKLFMAS